MTEKQREFYLLLCMTGRNEEACKFREECEDKKDKGEVRKGEIT